MTRALVQLDLWLLGALLVVGLPLVTVVVQALVRCVAPPIVRGEHNDVAGFLIAVMGEWEALDRGRSSPAAFALVGRLFDALGSVAATTPAHEAFLADALVRLDDVAADRAERISVAEGGLLPVLWAAIIVGGGVTLAFALLFGVANKWLHFLMVGAFAAVLALQVFVVLVLSHPFSGDLRVDPDPFLHVVRDFG